MVWWVYQQALKANFLSDVVIATDDRRILEVCTRLDMKAVMTSPEHRTSTERVLEVARSDSADLYVCINGDEPLISPLCIDAVIPNKVSTEVEVLNIMAPIRSTAELIDPTNIKVVVDTNGNAMYFSRSVIPHHKTGTLENSLSEFTYFKHVGVLAYTRGALELFAAEPRRSAEEVEDINELRFLEAGVAIRMVPFESGGSISVDVPADLEFARTVLERKLRNQL
ncbi:3-deoxy-manno-octulosonate cytidylyltransferase [Mycolicibacterium aurum]|uniref:3-deoxy-manno-octulosonate cytidylyltransferase n=2 Tax=Mycolicibacterium aurum TaxID=1791 RepID=A0A3S4VPE1_MYCAU|nr:3-deoxy-manno-octulosonate cytidylyltransferase [Mycolicibacterium aurum]